MGRKNKGIVLLLVLMVISILIMLVGQFSWSSFIEGALSENEVKDIQAELDIKSGLTILKRAIELGEISPLSFDLKSGKITISWESESGKININNLRSENISQENERLERLFEILEEKKILQVLGLADKIIDFVLSSERPILSMRELMQIDEINEEVITSLSPYLTVYSDGKLDIYSSKDEILFSLDERINSPNMAEMFRDSIRTKNKKAPSWMNKLAREMKGIISDTTTAWKAMIRLEGPFSLRVYEAALKRDGEKIKIIMVNELEGEVENVAF